MGYDVPMERQIKKASPEELKLSEGEKMLLDLFSQVSEEDQEFLLKLIALRLDNPKQ